MIAVPVRADVFVAQNGAKVARDATTFSVLDDAGQGARGMWCAAADYGRTVLGASGEQRLYIAQGRAPGLGQRAPVQFTLDPTDLEPRSVFLVGASLRQTGATLSVDHAFTFCADARAGMR